MRTGLVLVTLVLWLGMRQSGLAQLADKKDLRRIEAAEVKVFSAPGQGTLATGVLRRGAVVEVLRDRGDGWLEIVPPEGSYSWINDRAVENRGSALLVAGRTAVPLRVGSMDLHDRPTNAIAGEVQPGTLLVPFKSTPILAEGGRWWKVLPNPSERRYLQQSAVQPAGTAVPAQEPEQRNATPVPPSEDRIRSLWHQAHDFENAGNLREAIRQYDELARVATEETQRMNALNRAEYLRNRLRGVPAAPQGRPEPQRQPPNASPAVQPRAQPGKPGVPNYPVGTAPPTGLGNATGSTVTAVGRLDGTMFSIDGRPAFALVSSQGLPRMYLTAEPNLRLEEFLNRNVEVSGVATYRGELRVNHLRVTQVAPLR